jgi:hypothetical protein
VRSKIFVKMSRKSKSWIESVTDWLPSWPKRSVKSKSMTDVGKDPEVEINKFPERYDDARNASAATAPGWLMNEPHAQRDHMIKDRSMGGGQEGAFAAGDVVRAPGNPNQVLHSTPVRDQVVRDFEIDDSPDRRRRDRKNLYADKPYRNSGDGLFGDRNGNYHSRGDFKQDHNPYGGRYDPNPYVRRYGDPVYSEYRQDSNPYVGRYQDIACNDFRQDLNRERQDFNPNGGRYYDPVCNDFRQDPNRGRHDFEPPRRFNDVRYPRYRNSRHSSDYDENWRRGNEYNEHSSRNRQYRKEKFPDKFDGEKTDWVDYKKHFDAVANWNDWDYKERAMQLAMSLQGEAQKLLGDLPMSVQKDYNSLVGELSDRFNPGERETAYRLEFRNRMRKPEESPMMFGHCLRRLAGKAFPKISMDDREYWVIDQFVNGLRNSETKKHVLFGRPKTINDAVALAIEAESFETMSKDRLNRKPNISALTSDEGDVLKMSGQHDSSEQILKEMKNMLTSTMKELETLKGQVNSNSFQGKSGNFSRQNNGKKFVCYFCHEEGHTKRTCPKLTEKSGGNAAIKEITSDDQEN